MSINTTKLEYARRALKKIEEGESAFCTRIANLSADEQAKALEWFHRMREKQCARVQRLESEEGVSDHSSLHSRSGPT